MRPSSSAKIRRAATLSASRSQAASSSSRATPTRTSIPAPIEPTVSPSTRTAARDTRCTSARTNGGAPRDLGGAPLDLAQLGRRLLGGDDVQVHAGAELEAGHVRQARHDVDAPAEVLGAEGSGAHPEVQWRDVAALATQAARGVGEGGRAGGGPRPPTGPR